MKKILIVMGLMIVGLISFAHVEGPVEGENVFDHLHKGEKRAILMVHFGTTFDETREKTIDATNAHVTEDFGDDFEIREAYSSRQVINVLKSRGIHKDNPIEALNKLEKDGYTHVIVQMTTVLNGIESENLKKEVAMFEDKFKVIRIGTPLLTNLEDYEKVANALVKEIKVDNNTAVVLVGHGTPHYSSASYSKMDHIFKTMGYNNFFVGALQGYLTEEVVEKMVAKDGYKKVVLAPFMLVAGDHTINDIGEDWVDAFEKEGYETELLTIKAVKALEKSDVVILPRANTKNYSTAFEIAKGYMRKDIEKVFLDFTTVDNDKIREEDRLEYSKIVNKLVKEGKTISFITIGDPMTLSTFVYAMELLEDKIEIESIPGITSFASVTSRLKTPLLMGDETLKVVPIAKETNLVSEIESADNIIFMKVTRNLERLKEAFRETGNMENAVLISNCGKESEKIYYDLEDITRDDISYFSTILLKKDGVRKWQKYTS